MLTNPTVAGLIALLITCAFSISLLLLLEKYWINDDSPYDADDLSQRFSQVKDEVRRRERLLVILVSIAHTVFVAAIVWSSTKKIRRTAWLTLSVLAFTPIVPIISPNAAGPFDLALAVIDKFPEIIEALVTIFDSNASPP